MTAETTSSIDTALFREVMGHYPTGVVVVTGTDAGGEPVGMVVGTFNSLSLSPPMVSFMPTVGSATFGRLRTSSVYCINVLAHDQLDLCRRMAANRPDKFDTVAWTRAELGVPMLDDAVAHVYCTSRQTIEMGDHYIEVCDVLDLHVTRPTTPLLFFQGGYGGFSLQGMSAMSDNDLLAAVQVGEVSRLELERVARSVGGVSMLFVAVPHDAMVAVASGHSQGTTLDSPLGERVPLVPPLGLSYIAFQDDDEVERWLKRSPSRDPATLERYRGHVAQTRKRGFSMSTIRGAETSYTKMTAAVHEFALGGLTPARDRAIRRTLEAASGLYDAFEIDDATELVVGGITVPVRDPDGSVAMSLRVTDLPPTISGRRVGEVVGELRRSADAITRALADGSHDPRVAAYLAWRAGAGKGRR